MIVITVPDVRAVVEPKGYLITPAIWRKRLSIGWDWPRSPPAIGAARSATSAHGLTMSWRNSKALN